MTNTVPADRCPGCGGVIAVIGRVHRCSGHLLALADPAKRPQGTALYKYRRDADKWRAYQRDLMRKRRGNASKRSEA